MIAFGLKHDSVSWAVRAGVPLQPATYYVAIVPCVGSNWNECLCSNQRQKLDLCRCSDVAPGKDLRTRVTFIILLTFQFGRQRKF